MSTILQIWNVIDWLIDPSHHWLTAILLGLLVFGLAWVLSLPACGIQRLIARRKLSGDVWQYILIRSAIAGLLGWLASFPLLNYGWQLYTQPWDPPLELTTKMLGLPDGYVIFWVIFIALVVVFGIAALWLLYQIHKTLQERLCDHCAPPEW